MNYPWWVEALVGRDPYSNDITKGCAVRQLGPGDYIAEKGGKSGRGATVRAAVEALARALRAK